jgi:hypothetical protein
MLGRNGDKIVALCSIDAEYPQTTVWRFPVTKIDPYFEGAWGRL